jgi:hypothetical protein
MFDAFPGIIFEEKKIALESSCNYVWCLVVENLLSHPEDLPRHQHLQQSTANTVSKSWVLDAVYGFVFRFVKHVLRSRVMPNASKFPHFEAPHDTKHTTKVPPTMCPKHRFSMLFRVFEFRFGHACLTLNLCHTPIVPCVTTLLSRTSQHHHGASKMTVVCFWRFWIAILGVHAQKGRV